MNFCNQGISRPGTAAVLLKLFEIRKWGFKKYGAKQYMPLSKAANDALKKNKVSRSFFRRFEAKHTELMKKRQGMVSMSRALNYLREMAKNHINELATKLIRLGIFTDAE